MGRRGRTACVRAEIVPSRWDDDPVGRAEAIITGLAGVRGVALEWVTAAGRTRIFIRARDAAALARVRPLLRAHVPQAALPPPRRGILRG